MPTILTTKKVLFKLTEKFHSQQLIARNDDDDDNYKTGDGCAKWDKFSSDAKPSSQSMESTKPRSSFSSVAERWTANKNLHTQQRNTFRLGTWIEINFMVAWFSTRYSRYSQRLAPAIRRFTEETAIAMALRRIGGGLFTRHKNYPAVISIIVAYFEICNGEKRVCRF